MASKRGKSRNKEVVAIVQARMSSTRLPGKVMADIAGKPLVWHIVNRLTYSKLINKVVISTTTKDADAPVRNLAKEYNIPYYAGSETDLIDRFYQTARLFNGSIIIRVTGDTSLIDPQIVDKAVAFFLKNTDKYDYVTNYHPTPTYPNGMDFEVFSFSLLEDLWKKIKDPVKREWFTTVIFKNPKKYRIFCLKNDRDLYHVLRFTVDYKEDLDLVRYIYGKLYEPNGCFFLKDILKLYSKSKNIFNINKKYITDEDISVKREGKNNVSSIFRREKNLS